MLHTALFIAALLFPLLALQAADAEPEGAPHPKHLPDFDRLWDDYDHLEATERKFRELLTAAEKAGDLSYLLQLQTQIARCQGLEGRFAECHATLDAVEKRLNDDVPVARIRYLLERGREFNSSDHPDQAKPLFIAAEERATAAKENRFAIDAAHMVALAATDLKTQVEWSNKGLALAETTPSQQRWATAILNNLGEAYRAHKQYQKALDCFEKLAQWYRDHHREPDIFTMKDIARMDRLLGKPDKALVIIEPIARKLKSENHPNGYISAEYGQCLAALGRREEARPYLIEAYEKLSKDDYMVKYEPEELRRIKELAGIGD